MNELLVRTITIHSTSEEDPNRTTIFLADGAAGNTAIDAIIVFDGVTDAVVSETQILYESARAESFRV